MRRRIIRTAASAAGVAAALYLAAVGYLYFFQRDYVFKPGGELRTPAERGLEGVEVIAIRANDGAILSGWYAAAAPGHPTLLYFHGNAGTISGRSERFRQVIDTGFGLLAMSYRGYPGSEGSPSEAALFSDALEIFDWLAERTDRIVVYGESLGTAVACHVAAGREAGALLLEAPFTSALDIAATTYPWVPVGLLMRDPFLSRDAITKVDEPVLILHGTADRVVPVDHGRSLFEVAGEPKRLAIIEGAGHSDLWDRRLWPIVLDFLNANGVASQPQA